MRVVPIPCLEDNYAYLVVASDESTVAVVDPSEAAPVRAALEKAGLTPTALWLTHHHHDHVGGIDELLRGFPGLEVIGSAYELEKGRIPHQTKGVDDAETFPFGDATVFVMAVPGHTLGAVTFVVDGNAFTGDTLFLAGCGRLFEGTPDMMAASLDKLRRLPPGTRLWCGHEYTEKNLVFAKHADPSNGSVDAAIERVRSVRAKGEPSVPWTLAEDLAVNPFLRFDRPELARGGTPTESFARLRSEKDTFRG
ncbi:MAG: hydroxyacylglutathione hydrolase [Polyangiales bacterium]|nr:hydroxyacylglutathione hydrolase [Myxococcales bacterium]